MTVNRTVGSVYCTNGIGHYSVDSAMFYCRQTMDSASCARVRHSPGWSGQWTVFRMTGHNVCTVQYCSNSGGSLMESARMGRNINYLFVDKILNNAKENSTNM